MVARSPRSKRPRPFAEVLHREIGMALVRVKDSSVYFVRPCRGGLSFQKCSEQGGERYTVALRQGKALGCTCKARVLGHKVCRHMRAVAELAAKRGTEVKAGESA